MHIALQVPEFTWPGGTQYLGPTLVDIASTADDVGFYALTVMDHFFQIDALGPPEHDMLEAYTTLGCLASHTRNTKLFALATGVMYRHPGVLAKMVTTLDVLSGGRAWLGIGASWNEYEAAGLGLPLPPLPEQLERLEEALQIFQRMWSDDDAPYVGHYYQLARPLNVPPPLSSPHPPILIGGGERRETLRLVARYADACNVLLGAQLDENLDLLRQECDREQRDYDSIMKTCYIRFDIGHDGRNVPQILRQLRNLCDLGFSMAIGQVVDAHLITPLEIVGRRIIPEVADW